MIVELPEESCQNMIRRLRQQAQSLAVESDVAAKLIDEYDELVMSLVSDYSSAFRQEFAYGRLLGVRGQLCRLCPSHMMRLLPRKALDKWQRAERSLRDFLSGKTQTAQMTDIAQRVESCWAISSERYIQVMSSQATSAEISDQMGLLKGIDTIALHLAQREIFDLSGTLSIPVDNAQAVKLRMRLLSLFLTLHRCRFCAAFRAIQSYRETFRIYDPLAYPWWFVDCRLTERQLNWTYRRLGEDELGWRF